VCGGIHPKALERIEIQILNIKRGWFKNNLKLVVMLETVGILAIAPIRGTAGGFHICDIPGFWTQRAEKSCGIEGSGTLFYIVGLLNDTPFLSPVVLQGQN
jgi:hypothetical protein